MQICREMEMRVRVKQERSNYWAVQVWRWWWPFWFEVDSETTFDKAKTIADTIKNPTILEVQ